MTPEFKVTAKDADAVRRCVAEMIRKPHFGTVGSYEEGVIDTIAWLLGEQDCVAECRPKKRSNRRSNRETR